MGQRRPQRLLLLLLLLLLLGCMWRVESVLVGLLVWLLWVVVVVVRRAHHPKAGGPTGSVVGPVAVAVWRGRG